MGGSSSWVIFDMQSFLTMLMFHSRFAWWLKKPPELKFPTIPPFQTSGIPTYCILSWFNQDRVKFPQQRGGALAGLFRYHADVTSWQVTFSWLLTAVFGSYFALFIAVTITVIVIVVVCCVAIALLY